MKYLEWNDQIAKEFFKSDQSEKRVWLSVEKDLIEEIAKRNNLGFDDFIEALKTGPEWVTNNNQNICIKAYYTFKNWRERQSLKYPPYIAYLALFTLAVNHGDSEEFLERDYYGRLNDLLKSDQKVSTPQFKKTLDLWKDIEKWSSEDRKGEFGEFHFDIYGQRIYVGIPLYQVVFSERDRQKLPEFFWKMGWDSNSNPTDKELLDALKEKKNIFSRKTSKRIENSESEVLQRLIDRVLAELEEYDEDHVDVTGQVQRQKRGFIDLCLEVDKTARKVSISFRCRRIAGLSEDVFILKNQDKEWKTSPSSLSSISSPIENFSLDNLEKDFSAESETCRFRYQGQKYKVFTKANKFGINGWISGQRYNPSEPFYLAVHSSFVNDVQKWGEKECDKCESLPFNGDLPKDWQLFKIEGVNGDRLIKDIIPSLAINERQKVLFEEGIRPSRGNKFFDFAPPKISIIGGKNQIQSLFYKASDQKVRLISVDGSFQLPEPENIPLGEDIKILTGESKEIAKLVLVKSQLKQFSDYEGQLQVDCFGNFQDRQENSQKPEELYLQGVYGPYLKHTNNYKKLPSPLSQSGKNAYFIGNNKEEIMRWQKNPWPESWTPSWVLQQCGKKKKFEVHCYIEEDYTKQSQLIENIKDIRRKEYDWKAIVENKKNKFELVCGHDQCEKKWEQFKKKHRLFRPKKYRKRA